MSRQPVDEHRRADASEEEDAGPRDAASGRRCRPAEEGAIQPKTGVQIGRPVRRRHEEEQRRPPSGSRARPGGGGRSRRPTTTSSRRAGPGATPSERSTSSRSLDGPSRVLCGLLRARRHEVAEGRRSPRRGWRRRPGAAAPTSRTRTASGTCGSRGQAVPLGVVAVGEHGDHAGAADAGRVVERGLGEAVGLELLDPRRWPSATMSSLVPNWRQPVGQAFTQAGSRPTPTRSTQSVHFAILPRLGVEARHVERAARLAVAAADARPSGSRPRCRSRTGRSRRAPGRPRGSPDPRSACTGPCASARRGRPSNSCSLKRIRFQNSASQRRASSGRCRSAAVGTGSQVVPLLAGHLAGLAADAGRGVDVLRDDGQVAHARLLAPERGRGAADLEAVGPGSSVTPSPAAPGTPCTPASRCSGPWPRA